MQLSMGGAQKTSSESKKLMGYSKQWLPGDTMRLFFPVFKMDGRWEVAVGALWGHKVNDFDGIGLKTTFIPSLTEFDVETATPIGAPDITYQFSQIAGVFVNGKKQIEMENLQKKNWPTEAARLDALRKLEDKYDAKNNMKAEKPAIGKVTYLICTEVLCIKYTNQQPVLDTAAVVSFPLSSEKITKLQTILNDPKFAPQEGDKFFEIEWKYPANPDKSQSAKASSPNGLTVEYRMAQQNPEVYAAITPKFAQIATECESIVRRATRKVSEAKIRNALTQYAISNCDNLDACPEDDVEYLLRNCSVVNELSVLKSMSNVELVEKIKAELAAHPPIQPDTLPDLSAGLGDVTQSTTPAPAPATDLGAENVDLGATAGVDLGTTTGVDLGATASVDLGAATGVDLSAAATAGAPTVDQLLNNSNIAGMDDTEMDGVNLDLM